MARDPSPENLTPDQERALDDAAMVIIRAQREAVLILERARIFWPPEGGFGSHCTAHIPAHGPCPCSRYVGEGGPCENRITIDPHATPPRDMCSHSPREHIFG